MNVEVRENDVTKVFIVQKLVDSQTTPPSSGGTNATVIGLFSASSSVILIIILVLICICRRRRRRRRTLRKRRVISTSTVTTSCPPSSVYVIPRSYPTQVELRTTEDVTQRYQRSVSNLSAKSQIYLVPFSVLPPNFDFASREVEVKADYVILKDLSFLEKYPSSGVVNEAYEPQEPYNPYVGNGYVRQGQVGEQYQKQAPYNPTYVY